MRASRIFACFTAGALADELYPGFDWHALIFIVVWCFLFTVTQEFDEYRASLKA